MKSEVNKETAKQEPKNSIHTNDSGLLLPSVRFTKMTTVLDSKDKFLVVDVKVGNN